MSVMGMAHYGPPMLSIAGSHDVAACVEHGRAYESYLPQAPCLVACVCLVVHLQHLYALLSLLHCLFVVLRLCLSLSYSSVYPCVLGGSGAYKAALGSLCFSLLQVGETSTMTSRGSRYLVIKELGLRDQIQYGFWDPSPR